MIGFRRGLDISEQNIYSDTSIEYLEDDSEIDDLLGTNKSQNGKNTSATYEEAMEECEYGRFHWWLLLVCGLSNASEAVEMLCISFLLPSAECDLQMTSSEKGILTAMGFLGMVLGEYIWGTLGDVIGRKTMLVTSIVFNATFGAISSFAQSYWLFVLLRFFSGVGVGGSVPLTWAYFVEFQPKARRGRAMCFLASFWMVGSIVVAGLAWSIIPTNVGFHSENFSYSSWRVFALFTNLPSFITAILLSFMPESPKFLMCAGREKEALKVFNYIYDKNHPKSNESFSIRELYSEVDSKHRKNNNSIKHIFEYFAKICSQTKSIFRNARIARTTLTLMSITFLLNFGYFGLWMWFPEIFNRLKHYEMDHPGSTPTICGISQYHVNATNDPFHCDRPVEAQVYINSLLTALAQLPGNIWTIISVDKLGRRFFVTGSMISTGGAAFLLFAVHSSGNNLLMSCLFSFLSVMGFNSLGVVQTEHFDTESRSTGVALVLAFGKIGATLGNVAFGELIDYHCAIPITAVSLCLIVGGLMVFILPDKTREALI